MSTGTRGGTAATHGKLEATLTPGGDDGSLLLLFVVSVYVQQCGGDDGLGEKQDCCIRVADIFGQQLMSYL